MTISKQNWFKRSLSLLLAFILCMGMIGTTAFAENSGGNAAIEDGVYRVKVNLLHAMTNSYSMGNGSVRGSDSWSSTDDYRPMLIVEDGRGYLIMEFMPMSFANMYGYLLEFDTLSDIGYNQYSYPVSYTTHPAAVLAEHRMTDGTIALDAYNKETSILDKVRGQAYPHVVAVPVELPETAETPEAVACPFVHVYVPVMGELSSGDQVARLQVDYGNMTKVTDLSNEVEYWLYKAMNTDKGQAGDEAWQTLQDVVEDTKSKLSDTLVSIDSDGSNRKTSEMSTAARAAQVQKLQNAIGGVITSSSEHGWDGATVTEPKRKGTEVYVSTAAELAWVARQVNSNTCDFLRVYLTADIDLNHKPWTPIGLYNSGEGPAFFVEFYGNGHMVSNLFIDSHGYASGLFGYVEGTASAPAVIDGVKVTGSIAANNERTGGIAGFSKFSTITNCESYVNITQTETYKHSSQANAGGIVGYMGATTVSNCFNYGTISYRDGYQSIGGIVGWLNYATTQGVGSSITKCGNEGSLSGGKYIGGIVGYAFYSAEGTLELSELYNTGSISGSDGVGGILGYVTIASSKASPGTYSGMYNTGSVTSSTGNYVGGIAGNWTAKYPSVLSGMYAAGTLTITGSKTNHAAAFGRLSASGSSSDGNLTVDSLFYLSGLDTYAYLATSSVLSNVTEANILTGQAAFFKSNNFFTYMDDLAYLFARDTENINNSYPILAFQTKKSLSDAKAAAIKELEAYKNPADYKGAAANAFAKALAAQETAVWNAADEAAVAEALQQGKAALDTVPTDPNYNLNLDELNNALTAARAEAQKNGLYTAETISLLSKVISDTEGMLEYGFGSQTKVTETISRLENAVGALEYRPADYKAVNDAIEKANRLNSDDYEDFSEVEKALNAVVTGKNITAQAEVDAMAQAIKDAIEALKAKDPGVLDKDNLADGIYSIYVDMIKLDRVNKSMADNAINHTAKLEVIGGEYYVTLDFKGVTIENRFGYLMNLSYYKEGYAYGQFGVVEGTLSEAEVLSTQKDSDGNDVIDRYNDADNLYPDLIRIKVVSSAIADEDGYVPLHVFVPIMEAIAEGSGDQDVLMKVDWSSLKKTTEDDPGFAPEEPVWQSPAVEFNDSATGVTVHADKGVFDEGVQIVVTETAKGADYDITAASLSDVGKKFKLYNVKFLNKDGNEVSPNGTVAISFPVAEGYDSSKLALYRINDDGTKTLVKGAYEDGRYAVITRTGGASYALLETGSTVTDAQNTANVNGGTTSSPQTGDGSNIAVWFLLMIASAVMLGVSTLVRKRKFSEGK